MTKQFTENVEDYAKCLLDQELMKLVCDSISGRVGKTRSKLEVAMGTKFLLVARVLTKGTPFMKLQSEWVWALGLTGNNIKGLK